MTALHHELTVELPMGIRFEFRRMSVRMMTPYETSLTRARFTKLMRQDFRSEAAHIANVPTVYLQRHETHHILPVRLGGDNKNDNLALVEPSLHIALHGFIENQTRGMEVGDKRDIDIPCMRGVIWPTVAFH